MPGWPGRRRRRRMLRVTSRPAGVPVHGDGGRAGGGHSRSGGTPGPHPCAPLAALPPEDAMDPTRRSLRGLLAIALLCACSQALAATRVAAGQGLTLVLAEERAGGEDARARYFQGAFPLSQEAGMRELATLRVEKVLLGDGAPQGVGLYAWPGREAA